MKNNYPYHTEISPYGLTDESKINILWELLWPKITSITKWDNENGQGAEVKLEDGTVLSLCNADIEES